MLNEFYTTLLLQRLFSVIFWSAKVDPRQLAPRKKKIEEDHFFIVVVEIGSIPTLYVYLPFHSLYFSSRCEAD
jgi:hypothetical protein